MANLGGFSVGLIANQTVSGDGRLTSAGMEKIADFVKLMDAFNIPVVNFVDVTGFAATMAEEKAGLSKAAAAMTSAFANATSTKVSVIAGRAYGTAYVASNSKHIGADFVYAWPSASVLMMDAAAAVKIMYAEEIANGTIDTAGIAAKTIEFAEEQGNPYTAASRGYIDDIIEPAATRKRVIAALEMLYSKYVNQPAKKHSTI
jgi:acetyl-CoA carboxylase carboxyltransferase component